MTKRHLERLLAKYEPKIRNKFRSVMQKVKHQWTVAQLEAALEGGTIAAVLDDIEKAGGIVAAELASVQANAASHVATALTKQLDTLVHYDGTNARAVDALRRHRLRLVGGLRDDQRTAILDVLSDRVHENPRQQAVAIRDALGLGSAQERWIASYRRKLVALDRGALGMNLRDARFDEITERAIDTGKALTPAQVDKMVDRYAARALKYRSEVVARTESLRAVQEGAEEMYAQAIETGTVDPACTVCTWHAGSAPPTRDSHAAMKGQKRPFGVAFTSGAGYDLRYPCDPDAPASETVQCRCAKSTRVHATPEAAAAALRGAGYTGPIPASSTPTPAAAPVPAVVQPSPPPPPPPPALSTQLRPSVHAQVALVDLAAGRWTAARKSLQLEMEAESLSLAQMPSGTDRYGAMGTRSNLKANGVFHPFQNTITLRSDVAARAKDFASMYESDPAAIARAMDDVTAGNLTAEARGVLNAINGYRTVVHEVSHVYSPVSTFAFSGDGLFIEELTTEWTARAHLARSFGLPRKVWERAHAAQIGGYRGWTARTAEMVAEVRGIPFDEAAEAVEAASVEFKRLFTGTVTTSDEAMSQFVKLLPGDATMRTLYKDRLRAIARMSPHE